MSCKDRIERFGIKRGSGEPTIPVSSDHRNGDWIATDIYEGEMYQDTNTGIVYTRSGTSVVKAGAVPVEDVVLIFRTYQVGTGIPTIEEYFNPNNYTLTSFRDAAGIYRVTGLTGELMADTTQKYRLVVDANGLLGGSTLDVYPSTDTSIILRSYDNTGTLADNVIGEFSGGTSAIWNVVSVIKYS